MSHDSQRCREVWAALDRYPALSVQSVVIDSATYRWACLVRVPWDRYGKVASTMDDVNELARQLEQFECSQPAKTETAAAIEPIEHASGEIQLGLF